MQIFNGRTLKSVAIVIFAIVLGILWNNSQPFKFDFKLSPRFYLEIKSPECDKFEKAGLELDEVKIALNKKEEIAHNLSVQHQKLRIKIETMKVKIKNVEQHIIGQNETISTLIMQLSACNDNFNKLSYTTAEKKGHKEDKSSYSCKQGDIACYASIAARWLAGKVL